ncbi:pinin/SDK/memA/ protein conserved region-domain-containing protein [Mycotypha africana]|uniref:pinin/SDK/memA/ protein conserved region-domain-containing protein n=1 Tax=Mycotypha africana TaxID=64632 RepID=UPI002301588E|nr:pinin/SDK/memA/ protein conserved region-domain-containing protein [Mycotypha africana]KAI8973749.1 pinin/SDK/memA/ protein conserved region-domain-containing protein [Mycotypha africana]
MVQSSIVVSETNKALKRQTDDTGSSVEQPNEEVKRPRLTDTDAATKQRNKRLFGTLLGTLNKFKDDVAKTSDIDKNRQAINEKLQEKLDQERKELAEKLKARREEKLRLEEMKAQRERKLLEEKRELAEIIQKEKLANFLKTTTEPALYYLPQKLTDQMSETIKDQKEKALEARKQFELKNNDDSLSDTGDRYRHHNKDRDAYEDKDENVDEAKHKTAAEEVEINVNANAVTDSANDVAKPTDAKTEDDAKIETVEKVATPGHDEAAETPVQQVETDESKKE